jgi:hypothetical protein
MNEPLKIRVEDGEQFADLQAWMGGHEGVRVTPVPRASGPNAQGSAWDFLEVACGTGGALTAAVRALQLWIESRVTVIDITVGEQTFKVRTSDAKVVLQMVEEAARTLGAERSSGRGDV